MIVFGPVPSRRLGRSLEALTPLGIRRAVICNSSLLDREYVRQDLSRDSYACPLLPASSPSNREALP